MSWKELQHLANEESDVGKALTKDQALRESGYGEAHVSNTLRLFDKPADFQPKLTLYRDKAGWCPYCEKAMLLVEEKRIPIHIVTVNMRSYGDKPQEFLRMVPNGLLPALMVENDAGQKRVMTESQVIMEYLDAMHPVEEGYKRMVPAENDTQGQARYRYLAQLERQLFGAWCQLTFRPEGGMVGGLMSGLMGTGGGDKMSGAMKQFMQVVDEVDRSLLETSGPWFFESQSLMGEEGPSMIDFIYISHVERMLASCSHWKGLDMRSDKYRQKWKGLNAWLDAFELRPSYLGFKSDYYTTVMDIPPQYGPGYDGGFDKTRDGFQANILGTDDSSWTLPLSHDEPLQPLYIGLPLPACVLEAGGVTDYKTAEPLLMARTCRQVAGWKMASNGDKLAAFAARGGSKGGKNPRKTFQAPLADPYANPDEDVLPLVDAALRIVCQALLSESVDDTNLKSDLVNAVPSGARGDVVQSLIYLRERVGVPRDMPLAAARYLRAQLNWAIDSLNG
jgi:glutathione S-transferase